MCLCRKGVATALTACGIETGVSEDGVKLAYGVATALTACGIETLALGVVLGRNALLQRRLPLAVLKQ